MMQSTRPAIFRLKAEATDLRNDLPLFRLKAEATGVQNDPMKTAAMSANSACVSAGVRPRTLSE
jgi:hypothetical protein